MASNWKAGDNLILDGYWKRELNMIAHRLRIWSRCRYSAMRSYVDHKIDRGFLYSAAIIRKIVEDEKGAENAARKLQVQMPPLPVLKMTVPVKRYQHTDEDKFFANSRVFLDDYDLKHGCADTMPLMQVCNQIIHSYAWAVVHQGKHGIYGVLVASDLEKKKDIILLSVSDWISAIQEVTEEANI